MRISLFLNSTLSKSCVHSKGNDWFQQDQKPQRNPSSGSKWPFTYGASCSKQTGSPYSIISPVNRIKQLPAFLNASNELQWFINSRSAISQAFDSAVKQVYSLSGLLLFYFTLMLLSAQVAGLMLLLSSAVSLPIGFQFMLGSILFIAATAFKIMY